MLAILPRRNKYGSRSLKVFKITHLVLNLFLYDAGVTSVRYFNLRYMFRSHQIKASENCSCLKEPCDFNSCCTLRGIFQFHVFISWRDYELGWILEPVLLVKLMNFVTASGFSAIQAAMQGSVLVFFCCNCKYATKCDRVLVLCCAKIGYTYNGSCI